MRIGVQSGGLTETFGDELSYKMIREAGFEAIDWNIDHALPRDKFANAKEFKDICIFERPLDEILEYYEEELSLIKKNGLIISQAHAPFPAYLQGRPESLDYSIKVYNGCIELCNAVGCKNLVIHGISHIVGDNTMTKEDVWNLNMKLYSGLIETLQKTDVTVCLENIPIRSQLTSTYAELIGGICCNPHEAVEYIDTLNKMAGKECFGFCLDIGHLNICKTRCEDFIPVIGNRLKVLHVHDNDAISDLHLAPYSGTIRWDEFLGELKAIGYNHDICFETFRQILRTPDELAPAFLKLIHETGCYFRKKITE